MTCLSQRSVSFLGGYVGAAACRMAPNPVSKFRTSNSPGRRETNNVASAPVDLLRTHPLVEEILDSRREHAAGDERGWFSYRGHIYRLLSLARAVVPDRDNRDDKLAIAAAFHDIDVFSSLNSLGPFIRTMDAWLQRTGRGAWAEELAVIVAKHHHLIPTEDATRRWPRPSDRRTSTI
jgi:hypothetical protein